MSSLREPAQSLGILAIWEYLGEWVLVGLVTALLFFVFGTDIVRKGLCDRRSDLMLSLGIAVGVTAAIWGVFFAVLATEFGAWLRKRDQASSYSRGLATPIFASLAAFAVLLFTPSSPSKPLVVADTVLLLYAAVNLVTLVRNVNGLVRLWQTWEQTQR